MKLNPIARTALLALMFCGVVACSSSSDTEAPAATEPSSQGESGIDATTRRTNELAEEARRRAAEAEERIRRAALNTTVFYFDFDVAEFRSADREVLAHHARDLAANRNKRIRLEGHADERGTREYNIALGERRANAVMNYLVVNGASRNQIETVSLGEERPQARGSSENDYAQNRRVELIVR